MDILRAARKLRPLMPKEVDHWLRIRATADADLKLLIDRQIQAAARKHLGEDFERKALLSLPPKQRIRGAFNLGTVFYEQPKWPAGISAGELLQNLAIFGRSGAGKTNLTFHIIKQLMAKQVPVVFLDWKRTARHLLPQLHRHRVTMLYTGESTLPASVQPLHPASWLGTRHLRRAGRGCHG